MTYTFPPSLDPLRHYLRKRGFDGDAIKSSRQAAFVAQQLLNTRVKFPPRGQDMLPTLIMIQRAVPKSDDFVLELVETSPKRVIAKKGKKAAGKGRPKKPQPEYLIAFDPAGVSVGYHIFADGACVPNPGPGGWGVVVYKDGEEIHSIRGGDEAATNNSMELTAVLRAIRWATQYPTVAITIWTDSQYVCNGVNDWRHGWKAKGWQRGGDKADPKNRVLLNINLWQAIDAELCDPRAANIKVHWVKGHAGHIGNERADELAEMGRQQLSGNSGQLNDDLDAEYRAVMAG